MPRTCMRPCANSCCKGCLEKQTILTLLCDAPVHYSWKTALATCMTLVEDTLVAHLLKTVGKHSCERELLRYTHLIWDTVLWHFHGTILYLCGTFLQHCEDCEKKVLPDTAGHSFRTILEARSCSTSMCDTSHPQRYPNRSQGEHCANPTPNTWEPSAKHSERKCHSGAFGSIWF